jgi:hypothetical protein
VGYRPRTGTVFFTRNGKKLEDVAHGLKTQNFFPTVGANGPCTVHVNFGQSGFVFIEANVKKWGLAPMTGSLAPPPPYGSEQGSILLETGRESAQTPQSQSYQQRIAHGRSRSRFGVVNNPMSPGPVRSPTEISLAHLAHIPSNEDIGEGTSRSAEATSHIATAGLGLHLTTEPGEHGGGENFVYQSAEQPPPDYSSPEPSPRASNDGDGDERPLLGPESERPPIPSYEAATGQSVPAEGFDGRYERREEEGQERREEQDGHDEEDRSQPTTASDTSDEVEVEDVAPHEDAGRLEEDESDVESEHHQQLD